MDILVQGPQYLALDFIAKHRRFHRTSLCLCKGYYVFCECWRSNWHMEELDGSISLACVKEWTIRELLYVHTTFTRSWHALYDLASPCQIGLGTRRANTTIKPPEAFTVTSSNCGSKRVCCIPIRHYHGVRSLQSAVCGPPAHGCMPLNPNCDRSWILGLLLPLLLLPPPPP